MTLRDLTLTVALPVGVMLLACDSKGSDRDSGSDAGLDGATDSGPDGGPDSGDGGRDAETGADSSSDADPDSEPESPLVALVLLEGEEDPVSERTNLSLLAVDLSSDEVLARYDMQGDSRSMAATPEGDAIAVALGRGLDGQEGLLLSYDHGSRSFMLQSPLDAPVEMQRVAISPTGRTYFYGHDRVGYFGPDGELGTVFVLRDHVCSIHGSNPGLQCIAPLPDGSAVVLSSWSSRSVMVMDADLNDCTGVFLAYGPYGARGVTEICDDGNSLDGDGCDAECRPEALRTCGNGVTEAPEVCDDGNVE